METELQQAERTAKAWLEWPAVNQVATLARVFLAQQARLAEVQEGAEEEMRQRDHYRAMWQAAESRLASARVEGAREALTRCERWLSEGIDKDLLYAHEVAMWRDREYPAPAAPAGEARAWSCGKCGQSGERWEGCGMSECDANVPDAVRRAEIAKRYGHRPAPTPEPEPPIVPPLKVIAAFIAPINSSRWQGDLINVTEDGAWWRHADATCEWHRLVGPLGSRPTQTAEG